MFARGGTRMRKFFILAFIANMALTLISFFVLPSQVAIHFGLNGMADGWAPSYVYVLIMAGAQLFSFFLFCALHFFVPRLILSSPPELINLPNKEYWLSPANRPQVIEKIQNLFWRMGSALFLFLLIINALSIHANLSNINRLNLWVLFPALGTFLLYLIWLLIVFHRAFRMPERSVG